MDTLLITGGAGFIGSNLILKLLENKSYFIVNLDALTYAANLMNLASVEGNGRYVFVHGNIGDRILVREILRRYQPRFVVNLAAESHVDRSIDGPDVFVETNVVGTLHLLDEVRGYWNSLATGERALFRFLHVSTDEVFGSLSLDDPPFHEGTPYAPNSPYSASKAASDHFVRAYHHTYGLPTLTTNCSNNYGPRQFPEKLIPLMIFNAVNGKPLPVYGDGLNIRDWLYVEDHCEGLVEVLDRGVIGETYNIGGRCERTNIEIVRSVCSLLDERFPDSLHFPHASLIARVKDRPGHDRRYAINCTKLERELGWQPRETFETGIRKTVDWYLDNTEWVKSVASGTYRDWVVRHYGIA